MCKRLVKCIVIVTTLEKVSVQYIIQFSILANRKTFCSPLVTFLHFSKICKLQFKFFAVYNRVNHSTALIQPHSMLVEWKIFPQNLPEYLSNDTCPLFYKVSLTETDSSTILHENESILFTSNNYLLQRI